MWLWQLVAGAVPRVRDPILLPAAAWLVWSLVSTLASGDPAASVSQLGALLALLVIPATLTLLTVERWRALTTALAVTSSVSSVVALVQFVTAGGPLLDHRIHGLHSHYMTFAGWTLAVALMLLGDLLATPPSRRRWWLAGVVGLHLVALTLSLTRNAWVGLAGALVLAATLWRPRILLAAPLVAVVAVAVLPAAVRERVVSIADLEQHANRDRLAMVEAGLAMIADHPVTGVGPGQVKALYPDYRSERAVRERVSHLHNNPLMIAAERGLPAAAVWLAWLLVFAFGIRRDLADPDHPAPGVPAGCLLAMAGLTVAGMFEFNWGDSEIWLLTMVLLAAPAAVRREAG